MYLLHDNGASLFDSQATMTTLQRVFYLTAKGYHEEQMREEARENEDAPSTPSSTANVPRRF